MTVDELVEHLLADATLTGATLSSPRRAAELPARVTIDPVRVRGRLAYRFREHHSTRTVDTNLEPTASAARLREAIGAHYRQALLHAPDADWQILAGGKGEPRILKRAPTRVVATREHDRQKRRLIPAGTPVPFLVELGVMTKEGRVRDSRQDKYRQISRFAELVDDVLPSLPDGPLRVVDFGSGRSYLTFVLHHLLTAVRQREVEMIGLDLKEDVVAECEQLARRLDARGLRFEVGDIAGYAGTTGADLVVSLHACDTATDAALDRAVRGEARVILAVPCCQHELMDQLDNETLGPLLRHGTLRDRFAAEVTDAARAHLLRLAGYDVQVVEFVPLEHTPKNVLLRAVRRDTPLPPHDAERLALEYRTFADSLGIDPALERLLGDTLPALARAAP